MYEPLELGILERARELVANPATWSRCGRSVDRYGRKVGYLKGAHFCAQGAIYRTVYNRIGDDGCSRIALKIILNIPRLWSVNRYDGRKAALKLIDTRIAQLRGSSAEPGRC